MEALEQELVRWRCVWVVRNGFDAAQLVAGQKSRHGF